jgi:hypothetical protein
MHRQPSVRSGAAERYAIDLGDVLPIGVWMRVGAAKGQCASSRRAKRLPCFLGSQFARADSTVAVQMTSMILITDDGMLARFF